MATRRRARRMRRKTRRITRRRRTRFYGAGPLFSRMRQAPEPEPEPEPIYGPEPRPTDLVEVPMLNLQPGQSYYFESPPMGNPKVTQRYIGIHNKNNSYGFGLNVPIRYHVLFNNVRQIQKNQFIDTPKPYKIITDPTGWKFYERQQPELEDALKLRMNKQIISNAFGPYAVNQRIYLEK